MLAIVQLVQTHGGGMDESKEVHREVADDPPGLASLPYPLTTPTQVGGVH